MLAENLPNTNTPPPLTAYSVNCLMAGDFPVSLTIPLNTDGAGTSINLLERVSKC